jgi:hypothetical protein
MTASTFPYIPAGIRVPGIHALIAILIRIIMPCLIVKHATQMLTEGKTILMLNAITAIHEEPEEIKPEL